VSFRAKVKPPRTARRRGSTRGPQAEGALRLTTPPPKQQPRCATGPGLCPPGLPK